MFAIMPDKNYGKGPVRVRISRGLGVHPAWTMVDSQKALCSELLDIDGGVSKATKTAHLLG